MSSGKPSTSSQKRKPLHPMRSFTRMETSNTNPLARSRAQTVQAYTTSELTDVDPIPIPVTADEIDESHGPDLFEKQDSIETDPNGAVTPLEQPFALYQGFDTAPDELPVELASLTDRFVESLGAKVHSTPPTIDKIAALFQDFYIKAESHISIHISTLASRINREGPPVPSSQLKSSPREGAATMERIIADHQMLTASEVTEKRKARKQLSYKKVVMEETVERKACESVYSKLWRHKSTLDEERDEKLRSKTAALSLLGIGLKDLGIEIPTPDPRKVDNAMEQLAAARESLIRMNDEKYPLGKLQHLISAHKEIVETLTDILPSSSSADEILPTLIYTLISSPTEGINVISNLLFIQRFRSANKIDGEAAYCLTNLEAAITFLEDVDISSMSAEATPGGQPRLLSASMTPSAERPDPHGSSKQAASPSLTPGTVAPAVAQQRRLSNLFQPPSKVLEAANDAVRSTADQGLKNISNTLDNSFNFLFGRLKEMQSNQRGVRRPVVPKTLDEARRLVTSPTIIPDSVLSGQDNLSSEDQNLDRSATRDRSVDSSKSNDSYSKRPGPSSTGRASSNSRKDLAQPSPGAASSMMAPSPVSTPLESMRNFGNTINPLNHIPGMIRGFGRMHSESATPPLQSAAGAPPAIPGRLRPMSSAPTVPQVSSADVESTTARGRIDPPIQRFLDVDNVQDLKLGEVAELLEDYKRLAAAFASLES